MDKTTLRIALASTLALAAAGALRAEPNPESVDLHVSVGWFENHVDEIDNYPDADSGGVTASAGIDVPLQGGLDLLFSFSGGNQELGEYTEDPGYRLKIDASDWDFRAMIRYTLGKDNPVRPYVAGGLRISGYSVSYSERYDYYYRRQHHDGYWHEVDDDDETKAGYVAQAGIAADVVPEALTLFVEGTAFNQRGYSITYFDPDDDSSGHGTEVVVTGGARCFLGGGFYLSGSYSRGIESETDVFQIGGGFRF